MNERELFIASLQIEDPSLRLSYLEEECGHDSELRQRVTSLLKAFGQAGSFLQHPAVEPVVTIDQVRTVVSKAEKSVALLIQRDGDKIFVPVNLG